LGLPSTDGVRPLQKKIARIELVTKESQLSLIAKPSTNSGVFQHFYLKLQNVGASAFSF
jgi:hypothetical protein